MIDMSDEIYKMFEKSGALLTGHFQLTSGLHSAKYFQCAKVLQYPRYNTLLSNKIVDFFRSKEIDVVISPAVGGIVVGQEVGRQLKVRTIFAERKDGIMKLRRGFEIKKNEKVLVCEDVITTGGSVFEVIDLVKSEEADVIGVGVIVDRSGGSIKFSVDQISLVQLKAETYHPDECPLCKAGEPIRKPGSRHSGK